MPGKAEVRKEKERRKAFRKELSDPEKLKDWLYLWNYRQDKMRKILAKVSKKTKKTRTKDKKYIPTDVGASDVPGFDMAKAMAGSEYTEKMRRKCNFLSLNVQELRFK